MTWNWQQPDWPDFSWNRARFVKAEEVFLVESGEFAGMFNIWVARTMTSSRSRP